MLPQSENANEALTALLKQFSHAPGFPEEDAQFLLNTISFNEPKKKEEQTMETWKCTVCGYIHEGPITEDFICPRCKQPASKFVKVEPEAPKKNPYAGTQTEKNLEAAFAGESQARNKYTYFATRAKKDGFEQIAALFLKTADQGWPQAPRRTDEPLIAESPGPFLTERRRNKYCHSFRGSPS